MAKLGRLRFFDNQITVNRLNDGGYDESGRYVAGARTPVTIIGNIQPYIRTGSDTDRLPDGLSEADVKTLFTQDEIRTVDQFTDAEADLVELDGEDYVAYRVLNYSHTQLQLFHREVMLIRRDRRPV